ncbi:MAG: hypothetical protein AAF799_33250 [Myxococcota bacterium]
MVGPLAAWVLAATLGPPANEAPERPLGEAITVASETGTCADHDGITAQVATWTGRTTLSPRIAVDVESHATEPDALRIRIQRDGETILDRVFAPLPEDCAALDAAVGLAIAIALDSTVLDALASPSTPESRTVSPTTTTEPTEIETPPTAPTSRRPLDSAMRLQAGPSLGAPVQLGLAAQWLAVFGLHRLVRLRFGARTSWSAPQSLAGGQVSAFAMHLRADACMGTIPDSAPVLRIEGCLGVTGGPTLATGRGFDGARRDFGGHVELAGALALSLFPEHRFGLGLDLDVGVPVWRPRFALVDPASGQVTAALTSPSVAVALLLGPIARF